MTVPGFTVPGQVKYNLTRKYVLTGADAVVLTGDRFPGVRLDVRVDLGLGRREGVVGGERRHVEHVPGHELTERRV